MLTISTTGSKPISPATTPAAENAAIDQNRIASPHLRHPTRVSVSLDSAMLEGVPVWSTRRAGDPASVGHRMEADGFGRPSSPVCGLSTEGLYFRRDHSWDNVPEGQRCPACERAAQVMYV